MMQMLCPMPHPKRYEECSTVVGTAWSYPLLLLAMHIWHTDDLEMAGRSPHVCLGLHSLMAIYGPPFGA